MTLCNNSDVRDTRMYHLSTIDTFHNKNTHLFCKILIKGIVTMANVIVMRQCPQHNYIEG